jgi:hypothetical protein
MKRRMTLLCAGMAIVFVLLAVYFEPSHSVRGWLWGEAFFDGRPTSYWRKIVRRDLHVDAGTVKWIDLYNPPTPSAWDRCKQLVGYRITEYPSLKLVKSLDADDVLSELAADQDARIAGFANEILAEVRNRDPWDDRFRADDLCWKALIRKHNMRYGDAR